MSAASRWNFDEPTQDELPWEASNSNTTKILQTGLGDPYRFCAI